MGKVGAIVETAEQRMASVRESARIEGAGTLAMRVKEAEKKKVIEQQEAMGVLSSDGDISRAEVVRRYRAKQQEKEQMWAAGQTKLAEELKPVQQEIDELLGRAAALREALGLLPKQAEAAADTAPASDDQDVDAHAKAGSKKRWWRKGTAGKGHRSQSMDMATAAAVSAVAACGAG